MFGKLAPTKQQFQYLNKFYIKYRLCCIMCTEVVFVVNVLLIIFLLFAVVGICEFVYILKMMLYFPKIRVRHYSLVILKSGYALRQLSYMWQKIKWHGDSFALGIIAVTDDIDEAEYFDCKKFAEQKNIILSNLASIEPMGHL